MPMEKAPAAIRKHIAVIGRTNAGKSTLFNALTGQNAAIVSPQPGTTTDPVKISMELLPFGPVVIIDTAGFDDGSALGSERTRKTRQILRRSDAAIYAAEAACFDGGDYEAFLREKTDHVLVFTKCDEASDERLEALRSEYPEALFIDHGQRLETLSERLSALLSAQEPEELPLLGDIVPENGHVVLVTPVDSEAPKGRLILPQVQTLRECLDYGITATVCRETELERVLAATASVDLVVTDSQVFSYVDGLVPKEIPLTSFSILLARQKADFDRLLEGAERIELLSDGDRILILEGCTHNRTHEDIGRVKLPAAIKKKTGKLLFFDHSTGYDFPEELSSYRLAVQCGSCMLNRREISSRGELLEEAGIPVTNYGIALALCAGILDRASAVLKRDSR